ncbi:glycosyltransferase family 4 protein [Candidatus Parcubacteria bacterium]|nr:glycosyltransferase family 4 protein [Patescibacteria group bacterium]MCG2699750.1 glycosyltransferase family 4 protein [Candidatus Parcubacteria bacterium]
MRKNNDKKIRLGVFVDGDFIPSFDGAANRFHYLSRSLLWAGVEVVIFHGYRGWSDLKLIKKEKFKTYIFPIECYYNNLDLIASIIKKEKIDIIQFDNLEPIILQGINLSHLTKTYLVSEMHYVVRSLARDLGASATRIKTIKKIEETVGESIDHLICLSKDDKQFLIKNMNLSKSRISVMPSGVDTEDIKYWGPNFKEKTIIFLGNLFFEPNLEAVKIIYKYIYPKLKKYNFRFLIVGDCPKKVKARYQSANFKFTGTVKNLNQIFRKSTFGLAPILSGTGLRIKILNYLAAGIPVIATNVAVSGLTNKKNIIIEDDFKKYPQIIIDLINNKDRSIMLSRISRAMMCKDFKWKNIAERTKLIYQKILQLPLKNKSSLIGNIPKLKNKEPVWLEEAKKKKRFTERNKMKERFQYAIIQNNKFRIIK